MSFYSYKNANSDTCPGVVNGNILSGLNQRVCVQVKNVYDSCMQQEQLDDQRITIENIVPVLPGPDCLGNSGRACACDCDGNRCNCECPPASIPITHDEAVQNAENNPGPLPRPYGAWTFESCRSSTTAGRISNLSIERMPDRPQFARVRCTVDVPLDVLFLDQRCQEWMGQTTIQVDKDILLCIPDDSIIPFTLESLVSAICVSGSYIGNCAFDITVCVTVVLKVLAEVDILIPTYGFCQVPPCEEFAENVCDELNRLCYLLSLLFQRQQPPRSHAPGRSLYPSASGGLPSSPSSFSSRIVSSARMMNLGYTTPIRAVFSSIEMPSFAM